MRIDELQKSEALFTAALNGMRTMIHRVCKLTGAEKTCPYQYEHGDIDPFTCEICPLRIKQEKSNGKT